MITNHVIHSPYSCDVFFITANSQVILRVVREDEYGQRDDVELDDLPRKVREHILTSLYGKH